jgi:hypothetical protein
LVIRWIAWAIAALLKPKAQLVAENLCLRQQLVVLQRRQPRPRLLDADRRVTVLDDAGDRHLIVVDDYTERGAKHRAVASFYLDPKGRRPVSVTVQRVSATVQQQMRRTRSRSAAPISGCSPPP